MKTSVNIAVFASGSGTNAQQILDFFKCNNDINISVIMSNKIDAFVLQRAENFKVPSIVFNKNELNNGIVLKVLKEKNIDFIVLAGFLLKIPDELIIAYPDRIINIHPALLPKYGGKGMYGERVHQAVINNKEKQSGITIHYVNKIYDDGEILFQSKCEINESDTPDSLAEKIHSLEHKYFPKVIEGIVKNKFKI